MGTELAPPKGHGIVRVGHNLRHHVTDPRQWGSSPGTDFWAVGSQADMLSGGSNDLADFGWTSTGVFTGGGSGADFLSADDVGTPGGFSFGTASDLLVSPQVFGDYSHGLMVQSILGRFPVSLNLEMYARFAANAAETATGFGWIEAGSVSPITVGDHMAYIHSNGTNFALRNGATTTDVGAIDDTDAHLWKIKCSGTTAEWFIDGTSQGSIALQDDLWPVSFGAGVLAATGTNDPAIAWIHAWYE